VTGVENVDPTPAAAFKFAVTSTLAVAVGG